jgi:hypothetical protein
MNDACINLTFKIRDLLVKINDGRCSQKVNHFSINLVQISCRLRPLEPRNFNFLRSENKYADLIACDFGTTLAPLAASF